MAGGRVDGIEYARRVNAAAELVGTGMPVITAARTMAGRYGVSVRQARRYVEQAVAAGRIEIPEASVDLVLCYAPDRLARKFAYQVLLIEEFARAGTRVEFIRGPRGDSPED